MIHEKQKKAFQALKDKRGYTNALQSPRLVKVVVSSGIGRVNKDKQRVAIVADRLAKITGQKAAPRAAKRAVASFKTREGDIIGYQVTLRGKRMEGFLDKLFHVALPRTRDFRGISKKALDKNGNYTLGIREHTIFPEAADEELKDVFGLAVTLVTTAENQDEALDLFEHLGLPFAKAR